MKNISFLFSAAVIVSVSTLAQSQKITVQFDSLRWDLGRARVVEHMGRQALIGTAYLKDVTLASGIIEVDIATTARTRSYPGVLFRMKDQRNCERIYIRPHRSPFYDDALQYAAMFNGVDSWQLYNGKGKTAAIDIFPDTWNRLKIIVSGTMAEVYWNDGPNPVLVIDDLDHGDTSGLLGLMGPPDGTAYYSGFTYEKFDAPCSVNATPKIPTVGSISEWQLSEPFRVQYADFTTYPLKQIELSKSWQEIKADKNGVVDISRYFGRTFGAGDCIIGRTFLDAEKDTLLRVGFGYSDYITIYLNGHPVFFGGSAYQSRDRSFLGIMGYFDNLFLPLSKGKNELLVQVGESSGGWGFCFRTENDVYINPSLKKAWSLKGELAMPESAVYNPEKNEIYVSNYYNEGDEFISRISADGIVLDREWIKGLRMPTGMIIRGNTLYAVDRTGLNVIDIDKGEVVEKIPLTGMRAPNDVALDQEGNLYLSDLPANSVFRFAEGRLEKLIEGLNGPNALLAENGVLLIGQNEALLSYDLRTGEIKNITAFEPESNIDGIVPDGKGGYIVSDYHGKLYSVSGPGEKKVLLNTATYGTQLADFLFIPGKRLIVIPTFGENGIDAYYLSE